MNPKGILQMKPKWIVLIVLVVVALGVGLGLGLGLGLSSSSSTVTTTVSTSSLPTGTNNTTKLVFDAVPFESSRVTHVVPLGNLNPAAHTYSTNHMYAYPVDNTGFQVYAPGDIIMERVQQVESSVRPIDYSLYFRSTVNSNVTGRLTHLSTVDAVLNLDFTGGETESWSVADEDVTATNIYPNQSISSNTLLGTAGVGESSALDLWLEDANESETFLNSQIQSEFGNYVCFFDYYDEPLKTQLKAMIKNHDLVALPGCGQFAFDVAGTLSGFWRRKGLDYGNLRGEDYGLALVKNNLDPEQSAISVGLDSIGEGVYLVTDRTVDFATLTSGTFVTDNGTITVTLSGDTLTLSKDGGTIYEYIR